MKRSCPKATEDLRIPKSAPVWVFFGGIGFLAFAIWHWCQLQACARWPTVDAVVTVCSVTPEPKPLGANQGRGWPRGEHSSFAYAYEVNGEEYTSRNFYYLPVLPPGWILRQEFPVGLHLKARFHPDKPHVAIIEPGKPHYAVFAVGAVCVCLSAAGYIYDHLHRPLNAPALDLGKRI